ncbi:MAG: hypothetical protein ABEK75_11130 [Salinibacter sp.]
MVARWCDVLNDADSADRGNATEAISPLFRFYDTRFPNPAAVGGTDALRPFLDNAQQAAELDRQIQFTDGLIDQIVYRLYGLSDGEVAVVEGNQSRESS